MCVCGSNRPIVGRTNIRTLVSGERKSFYISFLRQFIELLAYNLQSKDELALVLLRGITGNKNCVQDFGRYDQFSDIAYTEAGEQCKATKFGRQVLLSFSSQSSKFQVLLHFANLIARRHSLSIVWSMFEHTWTEFIQHLPSYQSSSPTSVRDGQS